MTQSLKEVIINIIKDGEAERVSEREWGWARFETESTRGWNHEDFEKKIREHMEEWAEVLADKIVKSLSNKSIENLRALKKAKIKNWRKESICENVFYGEENFDLTKSVRWTKEEWKKYLTSDEAKKKEQTWGEVLEEMVPWKDMNSGERHGVKRMALWEERRTIKNWEKIVEAIIQEKGAVYNQNGLIITETEIQAIIKEYFRGTDLENVRFNWQEAVSISNLPSELVKLVFKGKEKIDGVLLTVDMVKFLINSTVQAGTEWNRFNSQEKRRAEEELKLRKWVLETAVNNNRLKNSITTDPKLIAISYKIDIGEEARLVYVATHLFNNQFGVNWSPFAVFSFVTTGLFGLVFLGYWFISKVKSMVRNRRNDNNQQNTQS